jgi:single-strand DNA-binding protein
MAGLNKVILIGNLGQEPEITTAQSGNQIAKFSIATSDGMRDKQTNEVKTEWHRCVAFGKTAEIIGNYVKKGSTISIEGSIQYGKYDNKDGATVYTTDIICNRVVLLDKRENNQGQQGNQQQQRSQQFNTQQQGDLDSLPF